MSKWIRYFTVFFRLHCGIYDKTGRRYFLRAKVGILGRIKCLDKWLASYRSPMPSIITFLFRSTECAHDVLLILTWDSWRKLVSSLSFSISSLLWVLDINLFLFTDSSTSFFSDSFIISRVSWVVLLLDIFFNRIQQPLWTPKETSNALNKRCVSLLNTHTRLVFHIQVFSSLPITQRRVFWQMLPLAVYFPF